MWSLIVAIVVGFFAGLIARALHPGDDEAGFIVTTLIGIAGSLLATYGGRPVFMEKIQRRALLLLSLVPSLFSLSIT